MHTSDSDLELNLWCLHVQCERKSEDRFRPGLELGQLDHGDTRVLSERFCERLKWKRGYLLLGRVRKASYLSFQDFSSSSAPMFKKPWDWHADKRNRRQATPVWSATRYATTERSSSRNHHQKKKLLVFLEAKRQKTDLILGWNFVCIGDVTRVGFRILPIAKKNHLPAVSFRWLVSFSAA